MEKYLLKRKDPESSQAPNADSPKQSHVEINLGDLSLDPGLRKRILDYDANVRDEVRRAYLLKGVCQPKSHEFSVTLFGKKTTNPGLEILDDQLDTYILDMLSSSDFLNLNGIADLALKMVKTQRDEVYSLVYLLIKLALTLSVSTSTIERSFSAMKIVKNRMRNKMGDQWMNDNLVAYIEKDVLAEVSNQDIADMFDKMNFRRRF